MITLSPFLRAREKQTEALKRVVSVLLQGIALHIYNFDAEQFVTFGIAVRKVRAEFEQGADETAALLAAGAAIRLLEQHGEGADRHWKTRQQEMEAVIAMLSETLLEVSGAAPGLVSSVREIGKDVAAGTEGARRRLSGCLAELRAEALASPLKTRSPNWPAAETDAITGLPDARGAALAFTSVWNRRDTYYAALLTLERLETINLRFGVRAGDRMLLQLSERVGQALTPEDQLFRWRGPCLLMLVRRETAEAFVASEVSRLAAIRTETAMSIGDREVIVPISVSWKLFPLRGMSSSEELMRLMSESAVNGPRNGRHVMAATM